MGESGLRDVGRLVVSAIARPALAGILLLSVTVFLLLRNDREVLGRWPDRAG